MTKEPIKSLENQADRLELHDAPDLNKVSLFSPQSRSRGVGFVCEQIFMRDMNLRYKDYSEEHAGTCNTMTSGVITLTIRDLKRGPAL